jgi:hypothetical protein
MISQGERGYCCGQRRQGNCSGQNVSNQQAEGAVRQLLAEVLPDLAELTRRVQVALRSSRDADLPADIRTLDREISARFELATEWKLQGVQPPSDFAEKIKDLQTRRAALADRLADADHADAERQRLLAVSGQFIDDNAFLSAFDRMTPAMQRATLSDLLEWVVVETNGGRGDRARAWVSDYATTFPNSVSELDSCTSWLNRLVAAAR